MTVTKHQAQMIANLASACRPTGARRWDTAGTMAALVKLHDRDLAEVVLATIRAAADRDAETPGVIPTPGSHWAERLAPAPFVPQTVSRQDRCSVCSHTETVCRMRWAGDHDFESVATALKRKAEPDIDPAAKVAALKAELAPTAGPTARRTLEDMAEANPELHARVEAVRAANPGLAAPPLREPQPPPPPDPAVVETEQQVTEETA
jgi:phage tail protein X